MSPGNSSYFFLKLAKWSKYTHTHKGPSNKSSLLLKTPSEKSTTPLPPLFHHEDATEKYQFSNYNGNIYLKWRVSLFHFCVRWFSKMHFGVKYLQTWVAHMLHSW